MVSVAMTVKKDHESTNSDTPLPATDKSSLGMNNSIDEGIQSKESDFAMKVRKPYTITKQRERWTEEEHERFLGALKLHGRAWRKIEEHVGTKTAVQIRSHAQKFFSKVARECNNEDASFASPIEIPPPRPKKKPVHPYPRKAISPVKNRISITEKPTPSPDLCISRREEQSPTSVLSANGSDASSGTYSCMPNGSPPTFSSTLGLNAGNNDSASEVPKVISDDPGFPPSCEDENFIPDEDVCLKLDSRESAVQCLKLFGKTLLVKDAHEISCSIPRTCKPEFLQRSDGISSFPWGVVPLSFAMSTPNYVFGASCNRSNDAQSDICNPRTMTDNPNPMDSCWSVPQPWFTLYGGGAPLSSLAVHNPRPIKVQPLCMKKEKLGKDEQDEGSSSGSSTDLVSPSSETEKTFLERRGDFGSSFSSYKLSKRISADSANCGKGFVPYKRCSREKGSLISLKGNAEVQEKQRSAFVCS